jgi:ParB family chromosome partitioning protein
MAKKGDIAEILKQRADENSAAAFSPDETAEYDSLFGLGCKRPEPTMAKLPLSKLVPFAEHPFRLYGEEKLLMLAGSIKEHGLHHPIIVRPRTGGNYEILAGHNRTEAFRLNGEMMIPAIVTEADDCRAAMIVTETNLRQREKILPSEKAFAYRLQLDAIKHQGKKAEGGTAEASNDAGLTGCVQIEHKSKSRDEVAASNGVDRNEVQRHIRLTFLISGLLELVDENKIPFIAGVHLSYLREPQQKTVLEYCTADKNAKPSIKAARAICEWAKNGKPINDISDIEKCLAVKPSRKRSGSKGVITFKRKILVPYLDRIPKGTDLESLFLEFLKERFGRVPERGSSEDISSRKQLP